MALVFDSTGADIPQRGVGAERLGEAPFSAADLEADDWHKLKRDSRADREAYERYAQAQSGTVTDAKANPALDLAKQVSDLVKGVIDKATEKPALDKLNGQIAELLAKTYASTQGSPAAKWAKLKEVSQTIDANIEYPYGVVVTTGGGAFDVRIIRGAEAQSADAPLPHPSDPKTFMAEVSDRIVVKFPADSAYFVNEERQFRGVGRAWEHVINAPDSPEKASLLNFVSDRLEFLAREALAKDGLDGIKKMNHMMNTVIKGEHGPHISVDDPKNPKSITLRHVRVAKDGEPGAFKLPNIRVPVVDIAGAPKREKVSIEHKELKPERTASFKGREVVATAQFPGQVLIQEAMRAHPDFALAKWMVDNPGQEAVANAVYDRAVAALREALPKGMFTGFSGSAAEINEDALAAGLGKMLDDKTPGQAVLAVMNYKTIWTAKQSSIIEDGKPSVESFDKSKVNVYEIDGKTVIGLNEDRLGIGVLIVPRKENLTGFVSTITAMQLTEKIAAGAQGQEMMVRIPAVKMAHKEDLAWMKGMKEKRSDGIDPLTIGAASMHSMVEMDYKGLSATVGFAAAADRSVVKPGLVVNGDFDIVFTLGGKFLQAVPVSREYFKKAAEATPKVK